MMKLELYTKWGTLWNPQRNGIVERKHQHLLNVTRSLLFQSNLPSIFWSYALIHFVVLINCIPTPFLGNKTPYEVLYETLYDITSLRVFGCLCFTSTIAANEKKLDPRVVTSSFFWDLSQTQKDMSLLTLRLEPFLSLEMSFFMKIVFLSLSKINLIPLQSYLCHLIPLILIGLVTFPRNHQLIIILLNLLPLFLILILYK